MKTIFEKLANLTECSCYYIENYSVEKESSVDKTWRIFPLGRHSAPVTASFLEKISFDHTEDFHKIPNVFTRDLKIFTALILIDNEDSMDAIVIGPVSIRALSESALKRYYSEYGLTPDIGRNPAVIPFRRFMRSGSFISCLSNDKQALHSAIGISRRSSAAFVTSATMDSFPSSVSLAAFLSVINGVASKPSVRT